MIEMNARGFIPDPTDPRKAIAPSGKLAASVFFAPAGADPQDPDAWTHVGFADPDWSKYPGSGYDAR